MKTKIDRVTAWKLKRNINILATVITVLIIGVAGLALWIGILIQNNMETKALLENNYQKSFYDMTDTLNDIEMKLSKLMVSFDHTKKTELASEIWMQSASAESNLGQLPLEHESIAGTAKFVNQLGDYVFSLNRKLINGEDYTAEDQDKLAELYINCRDINKSLKELSQKISKDYKITDHIKPAKNTRGKNDNVLKGGFDSMKKSQTEYPEMIYDGPFSDALEKRDYLFVKGKEEISSESGAKKIAEWFDAGNVKFTGKAESKLKTLDYTFTQKGCKKYVQLSLQGGFPVTVNSYRAVKKAKLGEEEAIQKAEEWGAKLLDDTLKSVWIAITDQNIAFINLAPVINDIVYYPDLIKVKIALDDGELLGWEAKSYMQNHTERALEEPSVSEQEAREKASSKLTVTGTRLALIPKDWGDEVLAWELYCEQNQDIYIIYVNAVTGKEENILKVINTEDRGNMLI